MMKVEVYAHELNGRILCSYTKFKEAQKFWVQWDNTSHAKMRRIDNASKVELEKGYYYDKGRQEEEVWRTLPKKISWGELKFERGIPSKECYEELIATLNPTIARKLVWPVMEDLFIGDKEADLISRQGMVLFTPDCTGVASPCEAILEYCDYSAFWEKFGLNVFDLRRLPQKTYLRLKRIMHIEDERRRWYRKQEEQKANQGKNVRVV